MKLNINDIARLANVSKATVSAVINDKPGVALKTRQKVQDIVVRHNYKPNHMARSLSVRSTKSIGLVIKEIDNPFYTKIMRGVYDVCSRHGYTVFLGSSELLWEQEEKTMEAFVQKQVDGLIVTPLNDFDRNSQSIANLIERNFPLVMVGQIKKYQTSSVRIDNIKAAKQAVTFLIKNGHTQIAYFSGPSNSLHSEERFQGYKEALIEAGLQLQSKWCIAAGPKFDDGFENGMQLFSGTSERPTAVFCYNDLVAIGLIQALKIQKIRVPQDIAVVGFDNIDFSRFANISLTTVENPAREMGEAAARMVLKQIENPDFILHDEIILDATLIERDSA
ncbi:MAG: LacI family transcriptional regulator [Calditrichaeota bacterium]|nr:MAG: LacI family transcriptional regulator [Calditrichota bacterium]